MKGLLAQEHPESVGRPDRNLPLLTLPSSGRIPRKQAVTSALEGLAEMTPWRMIVCMRSEQSTLLCPSGGPRVTLSLWTLRENGLRSSLLSD